MIDNLILIDGYICWLVLIYLVLQFIGFIVMGNAYLKAYRDMDYKDKQYRKLCSEYNILVGMYQRDTYKMPEVDEDD